MGQCIRLWNGALKEFRKKRNKIERGIEKNLDFWDEENILTNSLEKEEFDNKIKKSEDARKALTKN